MGDSERSDSSSARELLNNSRQETPYQPISMTSRILLSLSAGCLITGVLYLLFLLAIVRMGSNRGAGWVQLYDVVSSLWNPAVYCAAYLHSGGLDSGLRFIWLTVVCNVVIYSFAILVISSVYLKWVKR
jgi:hypothetical protein